jgi:toxin ParE1/3/4
MSGFVLTQAALADLKEIGCYTESRWGREQRNRYLAFLDEGFHLLAANPLMGRDCSDIREGYRKYVVGKHVIFYRSPDSGLVEITRILHQRMDVEARMGDA